MIRSILTVGIILGCGFSKKKSPHHSSKNFGVIGYSLAMRNYCKQPGRSGRCPAAVVGRLEGAHISHIQIEIFTTAGGGRGHGIAALVFGVAGVALHPLESDGEGGAKVEEFSPEVGI